MNKLVSILALITCLVSGSMPAYAEEEGVVTFLFRNSARYVIYLKMFSQERNINWGPFVLSDDGIHNARLRCLVGEKICFGGWYNSNTTFWGVGRDGNHTCVDCCLRCGTYDENRVHTWDLND